MRMFILGSSLSLAMAMVTTPLVFAGDLSGNAQADNAVKSDRLGGASTPSASATKLIVLFDSGSAEIREKFHPNLKAFADTFKAHPGATVDIAGHADNRGRESKNADLAQKRADAVKDYLVSTLGIDAARITAKGYGQVSERTSNATLDDKQTNRRAIATLSFPK